MRVAELEKEMRALRAMLEPAETSLHGSDSSNVRISSLTGGAGAESGSGSSRAENLSPASKTASQRSGDPVDRGFVSMTAARRLVEHYKSHMYPHYPIVYIPTSCTADDLRQTKPTLFLAILAGAAGAEHPDLAAELDRLVLEEYANRTVLNSEKSLELVQALLVSSSWYQPPTRLNQFKYSEFVHMAGMMATDIGIGSWPLIAGEFQSKGDSYVGEATRQERSAARNEGTANVESRRTFLAVLIKSTGTMITSRRPATMRVTSYARECLDYIEQSPEAVTGDRVLVAWARLLVIADKIGSAFCFDDPGAMASLFDLKTQLMTTSFKKRLSDWQRSSLDEFGSSATLRMTYFAVRLYLCETVLHVDHPPEDFKVPYRMSAMSPDRRRAMAVPIEPAASALLGLKDSSHALLDAFTSLTACLARALPLGMFVRASYGAFILTKLCASESCPHSELAPLIDRSSLSAEWHLNKTLLHVRGAIGPNGCRLPAIFLNLLSQMRMWCVYPELVELGDTQDCMDISGLPLGTVGRPEQGLGGRAAWRHLEDTSGSSSSPGTLDGVIGAQLVALTGTSEANYEQFGNEEIVRFATAQGLVGQDVDISDTLAQLEAALSEPAQRSEGTPAPANNQPGGGSCIVPVPTLSHCAAATWSPPNAVEPRCGENDAPFLGGLSEQDCFPADDEILYMDVADTPPWGTAWE